MFFTIVAMAFPLQREGLKSIRQPGEMVSEEGRSRFRICVATKSYPPHAPRSLHD